MVHKRYVWKNGKKHGPYYYESYREDGKVKKRYVGAPEEEKKKANLTLILLGAVVLLALFFVFGKGITGNVILGFDSEIGTNLELSIKEGELLPADTMLKVEEDGFVREFLFSDLVDLSALEGDYYVEGNNLGGSGFGFGVPGEAEIFPEISFEILIVRGEVDRGSSGSSGSSDSPGQSGNTPAADNSNAGGNSDNDNSNAGGNSDNDNSNAGGNSDNDNSNAGGNSDSSGDSDSSSEDSSDSSSDSEDSSPGNSGNSNAGGNNGQGNGVTGNVIFEQNVSGSSLITGNLILEGAIAQTLDENDEIVSGITSGDEPYVLRLGGNDRISLVSGSVKVNGEELDDSEVSLSVKGNELTVTTDYSTKGEGFGEDYLGSVGETVVIDLLELGYSDVSGLEISLTSGGNDLVVFDADEIVEETIEINETSGDLILIKEIPLIRITKGGSFDLDLSEYFRGANKYSFNVTNITGKVKGNILELTPDQEFKGARQAVIAASFRNESIESNQFNILVSSGNLKIEQGRGQVKLGEKVKWKTNVSTDVAENVSIQVHKSAQNIIVKKIEEEEIVEEEVVVNTVDEDGEIVDSETIGNEGQVVNEVEEEVAEEVIGDGIAQDNVEEALAEVINEEIVQEVSVDTEEIVASFLPYSSLFTITGRIIDDAGITGNVVSEEGEIIPEETIEIVIEVEEEDLIDEVDGTEEFILEYETEAPVAVEELTGNSDGVVKVVEISAPDELEYTDVFSFTEIPEEVAVGQEGSVQIRWVEGDQTMLADVYDLDGNGLLDYAEWITPHLSNQTFEVIYITEALHLNEAREVVQNVFTEVGELDGLTYEIPENQYLRVTFERPLSKGNDITVYGASSNGARFEIYEIGENELIGTSDSFGSSIDRNSVVLSGLSGSQTTFDLKIIDGSLDADYVIDPVISACGRVSSSGDYWLTANISAGGDCLNIAAHNVNITGYGYSIRHGASGSVGIVVNNTYENFSIKDTIIYHTVGASGQSHGINYRGEGGLIAINNTIVDRIYPQGSLRGIDVQGGANWPIETSKIENNTIIVGNPSSSPIVRGIFINSAPTSNSGFVIRGNNITAQSLGCASCNSDTIQTFFPWGMVIDNNWVYTKGAGDLEGIVVDHYRSTEGTNVTNNTVIIDASNGEGKNKGIRVAAEMVGVNVSGNLISLYTSNFSDGLDFRGNLSSVINNRILVQGIVDDGTGSNNGLFVGGRTLDLANVNGTTFADNVIVVNGSAYRNVGINLSHYAGENLFLDNYVNVTGSGDNNNALLIGSNVSYNNITGGVLNVTNGNAISFLNHDGDRTINNIFENVTLQSGGNYFDLEVRSNADGLELIDMIIGKYNFSYGSLFRFENRTIGNVEFIDDITAIESVNDLSANIVLGNNSANISYASSEGLNVSSNITFYKIGDRGLEGLALLRDGAECGTDCYNFTNLDAETVSFNVTSAGNYSIGSESTAPLVTINFPTAVTYGLSDLPLNFNVTLNENGTVMYSLHDGVAGTNVTMIGDGTGRFGDAFNITNDSIADGTYTMMVFANDTAGNKNYTENVTFTYSATAITTCQSISSAGIYSLGQDISGTGVCINITASDVIFNGEGMTIIYGSSGTGEGVQVAKGLENVSVKNLIINKSGVTGSDNFGIQYIAHVGGSEILNNTILTHGTLRNYGILFAGASNVTIANNTINTTGSSSKNYGIFMHTTSQNNSVLGNVIRTGGTQDNVGLYVNQNSNDLLVEHNTIITDGSSNLQDQGVYLAVSSSTVQHNKINTTTNSNSHGVYLIVASENTLYNNTISVEGSQSHGLYFDELSGSYPENNTIMENVFRVSGGRDDIHFVDSGINGTLFLDQVIANYTLRDSLILVNDSTHGGIRFLENVNGSGFNFSSDFIISNNSVTVNVTNKQGLNSSANITLYAVGNRSFDPINILREGVICNGTTNPSCYNFTELDANTVVFNVSGWSEYEVGEEVVGTPITSCQTISSSGTYALTQDITGITSDCFTITADDVILNGYGNSINRTSGAAQNNGVLISGAENVTVKNMQIHIFKALVNLSEANYSLIEGISSVSGSTGIFSHEAYHNNVSNNLITGQTFMGMEFDNSDNNTIMNNTAHSSVNHGIRLLVGSDYNLVVNNYVNETGGGSASAIIVIGTNNSIDSNRLYGGHKTSSGIYFLTSNNNSAINNTINQFKYRGIFVTSDNHRFVNNTINDINETGIEVQNGGYNIFEGGLINGSRRSGIRTYIGSSIGNNFTNIRIVNTSLEGYDVNFSTSPIDTMFIDMPHIGDYDIGGSNVGFEKTGLSSVYFGDVGTRNTGTNLTKEIVLGNNSVNISSFDSSEFNSSANITIFNAGEFGFNGTGLYEGGSECDVCSLLIDDGTVAKFNVSIAGNYSIGHDEFNPKVTINFPADQNYSVPDYPLNFNVSLNENGSVVYSLSEWATGTNYTMVDSSDQSGKIGKFFNLTNDSLAAGYYTFSVYTNDTTGNVNSSHSVNFEFDGTAPGVTVDSPLAQTYGISSIDFNITTDEAASLALFTLDNWANNYTLTTLTATTYNYTNGSISDGNYLVQFYVNDTFGNLNNTEQVNFTVDTTAPLVTINFPTNTTYAQGDLPLNFNVSLNENGSVVYSMHNFATGTNVTMPWSVDQVSVFGSLFNVTNDSIAEGGYTFSVYANDTVGNVNLTESVQFTYADVRGKAISSCGLIEESGYYTLTQDVTSTGSCINITAHNVLIDGNGKTITFGTGEGDSYGVFSRANTYNLSVRNANIKKGEGGGSNNYGIYSAVLPFGDIVNNTINTTGVSGNYGIYKPGATSVQNRTVIANNTINTNGTTQNHGIITAQSNTTIMGNNINASGINSNGVNYGIYINQGGSIGKDVLIENNTVLAESPGLNTPIAVDQMNVKIYGNYIRGQTTSNRGAGINATLRSAYLNISNNSIYYTATDATQRGAGIALAKYTSTIITEIEPMNATIFGNVINTTGIGTSGMIIISKNDIISNDITSGGHGIEFAQYQAGNSTGNLIKDNEIETFYRSGIASGQGVVGNQFINNDISSSGTLAHGYSFTASDGWNNITGGLINTTGGHGISFGYQFGVPMKLYGDHYIENVTVVSNDSVFEYGLVIDGWGNNLDMTGTMYLIDNYIEGYRINESSGDANLVFEDRINGKVEFLGDLHKLSGHNLSNVVRLGNNSATVESDIDNQFNVSANVTLYNVGDRFAQAALLKNGLFCGDCANFTALTEDTISFNVTSWTNYSVGEDPLPPQVTINTPLEGGFYDANNLSLLFNVSLNENGSVLYSLDDGVNNFSMTSADEASLFGTLFNASNGSIAVGSYTFNVYVNDTQGNNNFTESVTFTFNYISRNVTLDQGWNYFGVNIGKNLSGDRNISVSAGWNLIGYSSENAMLHEDLAFVNSTGNYTNWSVAADVEKTQYYMTYFDNNDSAGIEKYQYVGVNDDNLRENKAYWVYADEPGNITATSADGANESETIAWGSLKLNDGTEEKGLFQALSADWIGTPTDTVDTVVRHWVDGEYQGVSSAGSLETWDGYVMWVNKDDVTLVVES